MKWILFTGAEEPESRQRELDVRAAVRWALLHGRGVISSGTPGIDYYAITEALRFDPTGSRIKVILPTKLRDYIARYRLKMSKHRLSREVVDRLSAALLDLKILKPSNFVEIDPRQTPNSAAEDIVRKKEVELAEEVVAFSTQRENHMQRTLHEAKKKGLKVELVLEH